MISHSTPRTRDTSTSDVPRAYDAVVIGGGAAGLSGALLLGRARRRVLVIDSGTPRNRFAAHMHGVLGHEGTPPLDLLSTGREELSTYGVAIMQGDVASVTDIGRGLAVALEDGEVVHTRSLLVASGMIDELPEVPGLAELWGGDVFGCPYCHGWEVRERRLGVLASSPMSAHQAVLARQWSSHLTVLATEGAGLDDDTRRRLEARDVHFVDSPVVEAVSAEGRLRGLRTADGSLHELDALLVGALPCPRDGFLEPLGVVRAESPVGSFLRVDEMGRTSHPRIWAAGNVVDPRLNVPAAIGQAAMVGGAINMALTQEDTDDATLSATRWPEVADEDYWEELYAGTADRWSGRPNAPLISLLQDQRGKAAPASGAEVLGTALDIGCGEGADAIWLAEQGWETLGVDVSATAVGRAESAARRADVPAGRLRFRSDGALGIPTDARFDLVCVSYLHAPSQDRREDLLVRASEHVAPGGRLFLLSHVLDGEHDHDGATSAAASQEGVTSWADAESLGLDPVQWRVLRTAEPSRAVVIPGGDVIERADHALLLQRI